MRKDLSSMDFMFLVKELKELEGSKVDKIYQDENEFLFMFHATGKGKSMLRIILPKLIFIAKDKPEFPEKPSEFCQFLRKKITNSPIKSIEQVGQERILKLMFTGKEENFVIYLELFSKGNLIFCDENDKILSIFERQEWGSRRLSIKEKYALPKQGIISFDLKEDEFVKKFLESEKESAVKTLAINFGMGGLFAEEICFRSSVDKNRKEVSADAARRIFVSIKKVFSENIVPVIYSSDEKEEEFSPINLKSKESLTQKKEFKSYSELLESLSKTGFFFQKEERKGKTQKEIDKLNLIISQQEEQEKELNQSIEDNTKKAEAIYHNYQEIKEIITELNKAKEKHTWKEIKEKLNDHKTIKKINEKDKTVLVSLGD